MIKIQNLNHIYKNRNEHAVKDINLHIEKGESLVIIGSSGSGKSTLLKSINRLIEPSYGSILINGVDILNTHHKKVIETRGKIGMIFQHFNLIEGTSVLKNVLNGRLRHSKPIKTIFGRFSSQDYDIALQSIERVGLSNLRNERVANLSGGQKQRVGIARTLAQQPEIILADEPVSNLDPKLMKEIMDLLTGICQEKGLTLVSSLHFLTLAKNYSTKIVGIKNGQIIFQGTPNDLTEKDMVDIYGETEDWRLYGKTGF